MEFLFIYLGTVLTSLVIDRINYRVTLNKIMKEDRYVIKQAYDIAYNGVYGIKVWETLFPFYNVLKSGYQAYRASTTIPMFYDVLEEMDALEVMEPEKVKEFKLNPTPSTTQKLTRKHEKSISDLSIIVFNDKSVVFFDRNENGLNRIKRVVGPLKNEDIYTKYNKLDHAISLYEELCKKFIQDAGLYDMKPEELEELTHMQFNFDLSSIDDSISVEEFRELINKKDQKDIKEESVKKRVLKK